MITENMLTALEEKASAGELNAQETVMVVSGAAKLNMPKLITKHMPKAIKDHAVAGTLDRQSTGMILKTVGRLPVPEHVAASLKTISKMQTLERQLCDLKLLDIGGFKESLENDLFRNPQIKMRCREFAFAEDADSMLPRGAKFFGQPHEYRPLLELLNIAQKGLEPWYIFASSDLVEGIKAVIRNQVPTRSKGRTTRPRVRTESSVTEFIKGSPPGLS